MATRLWRARSEMCFFERQQPPLAHKFKCLVARVWHYLKLFKKIGSFGLIGKHEALLRGITGLLQVLLGYALRYENSMPGLVSLSPPVSLSLPTPRSVSLSPYLFLLPTGQDVKFLAIALETYLADSNHDYGLTF